MGVLSAQVVLALAVIASLAVIGLSLLCFRFLVLHRHDKSLGMARLAAAQGALRTSQERFELAVAGSSNGLWDWDVVTNEVFYAPRFKELLGYADHEMENTLEAWRRLVHPQDIDATWAAVQSHLKDRTPFSVRYRLMCKSGAYRWFHARGQAIWDTTGKATRMAGSIMDISDQIEAELQLLSSQRLYLSLVENLPVFLIRKDLEGRFEFANQAFCKLLGRSLEEIRGKTDYDFYPPELAEKYRRDDRHVIETGTLFEDVEDHVDSHGHHFFEVLKTQVVDATGEVVGSQCICWDVTDRKLAEIALTEAKKAAEAANQAKSEFLANMSHEIRTPMNAIIGMTELVLETPLAADQREYLTSVMEAAESLLTIINEILDFSKIEAGKLQLESTRFDLREMLGSALKSLGTRAHRKGLELTWSCEEKVPSFVIGDPTRLRQVIFNLVGNAIKFTSHGEVVLRVSLLEQRAETTRLEFSVSDTGIGIAAEDQEKIFDAFQQADASTTRQFGGTGLGLAIARRLVQLLGGDISVRSAPGQGSTFLFQANFGRDDSPPVESIVDSTKFQETCVLVADDNATNRRILIEVLRGWGLQVYAVDSGQAALDYLESLVSVPQPKPLPLLLSDFNMPGMDGHMLASLIRRDSRFSDLKIILLSSSMGMTLSNFDQLGVAALLVKPVKQSELFDAVSSAIGAHRPAPVHPVAETESMPPLNILLAEDGLANQKFAVGLLKRWGHRVTLAASGTQAIEAWEKESFDVILMDLQMPVMDGLEATQIIRQREAVTGKHIPIIALTAHAMSGDREKCLQAGMDGYITKPFKRQSLYEALTSVLT